jgi:hypothetical protein
MIGGIESALFFVFNSVDELSFPSLQTTDSIIEIVENEIGTMDFTALESAVGIFVYGNDIESISFPALLTVMIIDLIDNYNTEWIDFSSVEEVSGSSVGHSGIGHIGIEQMSALVGITFDSMTDCGSVYIADNDAVTTVSFPALQNAQGTIHIDHMHNLDWISMPSLIGAGVLQISECEDLDKVDFSSLQWTSSEVSFHRVVVQSIDLPSLVSVGSQFDISHSYNVWSVDISALATVGNSFRMYNLDGLQGLNAAALESVGSNLEFSFNFAVTWVAMPALKEVGGWTSPTTF